MRNSLFSKRIPTLFGLLLLGIGLVTLNYAVTNQVFFFTQATPTYSPEEIRITNLTDTSFSVSYTTKDNVLGTLSYEAAGLGEKVALDDRDQQAGNPQPYHLHHISVRNLKPGTNYSFAIISSDKRFLDNDKPFEVKTLAPLSQNPTTQPPIVGSVSYPDGTKNNNVIVFLVSDNAQIFSVLTKQDGNFVMPLNAIRTADFSSYLTFTQDSVIKLLAVGLDAYATVSVLTSQINPVPPITLNNSYDFTTSSELSPVPIASDAADTTSFPSFEATEASAPKPNIINPVNQETFNDQQPQFEGTAIPNAEVEIEINSETPIKTTVITNSNGSWNYRPSSQLAPGEHTITIKSKDTQGVLQTITRSFTIFAQGSQFTEPSVSPSQPIPSPTDNQVTPTLSPTPTTPESPTPTLSPTPTVMQVTGILTQSVPPPTQSPGSPLVLLSGIIAAVALSAGSILLFLGKGNSL